MTREEAIRRIKQHRDIHKLYESRAIKISEALDMAIKALKQPEIIHCGECRFNDGTAYCVFHFRDVKGNEYCAWAERRSDNV